MSKLESSILNMRDMSTMITSVPLGSSVLTVRGIDTISAPRRVDMLILCLVMMTIQRLLRIFVFFLRFLV